MKYLEYLEARDKLLEELAYMNPEFPEYEDITHELEMLKHET